MTTAEVEKCQECAAPAVHEVRPPGPLETFVWVRTCDEHLGQVVTMMRRVGWVGALVIEPGRIADFLPSERDDDRGEQ